MGTFVDSNIAPKRPSEKQKKKYKRQSEVSQARLIPHLCFCLSALKIVWLNSHKTNKTKVRKRSTTQCSCSHSGCLVSVSVTRVWKCSFFSICIFVCFCVLFFESIVHSLSCTNRHKRSRFSSLLVTLRCWSWKSAVKKKPKQQRSNLRSDSKSKIVSRGYMRIWMVLAVSWSEIVAMYLFEEGFYYGVNRVLQENQSNKQAKMI